MTPILKQLQERRTAALTAMDWQQHDAFDMLIGYIIGEHDMYAKTCGTVIKSHAETLQQINEEMRERA